MSDWLLNGDDFEDVYGLHISGAVGCGVHPLSVHVDEYAALPGGEYKGEKVHPRPFTLIGTLTGTTLANLHAQRQALISVMDTDEPVTITYTGAAVNKEITAYYESGLEVEFNTDEPCYWERVALNFLAEDPYWYATSSSSETLDSNDSATFRYVAAREGGIWHEMGPPSSGGLVLSIATTDDKVYLAGDFTNWNGDGDSDYVVVYDKDAGTYSSFGDGLNGAVRYITIGPDGYVYICGEFINAGSDSNADYIAKADPTDVSPAWENVGGGPGVGTVTAVYQCAFDHQGNLYIVGNFTNWDGTGADYIAVYDGSSWDEVVAGENPNSIVSCIAIDDDDIVYIGGTFTTINGTTYNRIAYYDGSWNSMGGGANNIVYVIVLTPDGSLYAGGNYISIGNVTTSFIARWNGSFWEELAGGLTGSQVSSIDVDANGILFVGGDISTAGGVTIYNGLAVWNKTTWYNFDLNIPSAVLRAISVNTDGNIWIGHDQNGTTGTFSGTTTVTNDGTAIAYPIITISRSGGTTATLKSLGNETTGTRIPLDYSLLDGETLTLDFTPGAKAFTSNFFGSRLGISNHNIVDFNLESGSNTISCFVDTSGGPTVIVTIEWTERYKGLD